MNNENNSSETGSAHASLHALYDELSQTVEKAKRRTRFTRVALVVITILLGIYLSIAYSQVADINAEVLLRNAQSAILNAAPEAQKRLVQQLKEQAPEMIDMLEEAARAAPPQFVAQFNRMMEAEIAYAIKQLDDEVYPILKMHLEQIRERHKDVPEERRTQLILDEIGQEYRTACIEAIDKFFDQYQERFDDALGYLDGLAEGKGTTELDRLRLELFQTLLTLVNKWEGEAKKKSLELGIPDPSPELKPGEPLLEDLLKPKKEE